MTVQAGFANCITSSRVSLKPRRTSATRTNDLFAMLTVPSKIYSNRLSAVTNQTRSSKMRLRAPETRSRSSSRLLTSCKPANLPTSYRLAGPSANCARRRSARYVSSVNWKAGSPCGWRRAAPASDVAARLREGELSGPTKHRCMASRFRSERAVLAGSSARPRDSCNV